MTRHYLHNFGMKHFTPNNFHDWAYGKNKVNLGSCSRLRFTFFCYAVPAVGFFAPLGRKYKGMEFEFLPLHTNLQTDQP